MKYLARRPTLFLWVMVLAVFLDISHWVGTGYANRERLPGGAPA